MDLMLDISIAFFKRSNCSEAGTVQNARGGSTVQMATCSRIGTVAAGRSDAKARQRLPMVLLLMPC